MHYTNKINIYDGYFDEDTCFGKEDTYMYYCIYLNMCIHILTINNTHLK